MPNVAFALPMPAQSSVSRDDRDLVVADEHLVDERRSEDAVPVERQVAERRSR